MLMTDLEMTKLCAEAVGLNAMIVGEEVKLTLPPLRGYVHTYDPLHDDTQAMALLRKFTLAVWGADYAAGEWKWHAESQVPDESPHELGHGDTPNRAIVECVARMQDATVGTNRK